MMGNTKTIDLTPTEVGTLNVWASVLDGALGYTMNKKAREMVETVRDDLRTNVKKNWPAGTRVKPKFLKNGGIILAEKPSLNKGETVVLALIPGSGTPFATWWMREDGETFSGDYFYDIVSAVNGYNRRAR